MRYFVLLIFVLCVILMAPAANASYRDLPDGAFVTCFQGLTVGEFNLNWDNWWDDCAYVCHPGEPFGIRVKSQGNTYEGDIVMFDGTMSTNADGQREIIFNEGMTWDYGCSLPRAYGLNQKNLGDKIAPKGSLVRVWGNVAKNSVDRRPLISSFSMSDGPVGPGSDPSKYTKAYDNFHYHSVDDGIFAITGVLDEEYDPSTGKMRPIVYQSYPGFENLEPRGPGRFSLSGKIIAGQAAAGLTAKMVSDSGYTEVLLDQNGESDYKLTLPEGNVTASVSIPGYHTLLTYGHLGQDYNGIDFYPFQTYLDLFISPDLALVSPGQSQILSAKCWSTEGVPVPNKVLTWSTNVGTIVPIDTCTDKNGVARALYTAGKEKQINVVFVQDEWGDMGGAGVDVRNQGDPQVIIRHPVNGEWLCGVVSLDIICNDTELAGSHTGIIKKELLVDGVKRASFSENDDQRTCTFDTSVLSNGEHVFQARATDRDGNVVGSNSVLVNVYNWVSEVSVSATEIYTNKAEPQKFVLKAKADGCWNMSIIDMRTGYEVAYEWSPDSGDIQFEWDGKVDGQYVPGIYKVEIYDDWSYQSSAAALSNPTTSANLATTRTRLANASLSTGWDMTSGDKWISQPKAKVTALKAASGTVKTESYPELETLDYNSGFYLTVTPDFGSALICGVLRGEPKWSKEATVTEMIAAMDACLARHVPFKCIVDPLWASDVDTNGPNPTLFRCGMDYWLKDCTRYFYLSTHGANIQDSDGHYRTYIDFADGVSICGSNGWVEQGFHQIYPAFSDLGLPTGYMSIAQINACYSSGCWSVPDESIAKGLGIYPNQLGGCYLGWRAKYRPRGVPVISGLAPNGMGWTTGFWKRLGQGKSVRQAIDSVNNSWDMSEWGWQSQALWIVDDLSSEINWLY